MVRGLTIQTLESSFDTSIINAGESAKVDTSKLTSGQQYPFHCTGHPYMTGTLKLRKASPVLEICLIQFHSWDIDPMQSQIFCSLQAITKKPKCFY